MKENYCILMLGKFYEQHTVRLVRNLKRVNPNITIDYFAFREEGVSLPEDYLSCFRECKLVPFTNWAKRIPVLGVVVEMCRLYKSFHSFAKNHHYDIVNLHFPRSVHFFMLNDFHRIANDFVVTPWGSDVLRARPFSQKVLKSIFRAADYVSGKSLIDKGAYCMKDVPAEKFFVISWGSEIIDYIKDHLRSVSTAEAKRRLGIEGCYAISCGYNASKGQQHLKMIEAIGKIKDRLPRNLVLLFPVTYPEARDYIFELKGIVDTLGIAALWFDRFLDNESVFLLRQATDMFIHVQITDGVNASLQEYLLCGKNCINGAWLKYPQLEANGQRPYHLVEDINMLDEAIMTAYQNGAPVISESVVSLIECRGSLQAAKTWDEFFSSIS